MNFSFLSQSYFFLQGFFFCRKVSSFAVTFFLFGASIFILSRVFFFCREVFTSVTSFSLLPWHLRATKSSKSLKISALRSYVHCELSTLHNKIDCFMETFNKAVSNLENTPCAILQNSIEFLQNELRPKDEIIKTLIETQTAFWKIYL